MTADAVDPSSSVDLTEERITAAMAKADARVCVGSRRCFALPYRLEDALASRSAQRAPEGAGQGGGTGRADVAPQAAAREAWRPAVRRSGCTTPQD